MEVLLSSVCCRISVFVSIKAESMFGKSKVDKYSNKEVNMKEYHTLFQNHCKNKFPAVNCSSASPIHQRVH